MVRVTKDSSSQVVDVSAPDQRLAAPVTNATQKGGNIDLVGALADKPGEAHLSDLSSSQKRPGYAGSRQSSNTTSPAVQMRLASSTRPDRVQTPKSSDRQTLGTSMSLTDDAKIVAPLAKQTATKPAATNHIKEVAASTKTPAKKTVPVVSSNQIGVGKSTSSQAPVQHERERKVATAAGSVGDLPPVSVQIPNKIQVASANRQLKSSQSSTARPPKSGAVLAARPEAADASPPPPTPSTTTPHPPKKQTVVAEIGNKRRSPTPRVDDLQADELIASGSRQSDGPIQTRKLKTLPDSVAKSNVEKESATGSSADVSTLDSVATIEKAAAAAAESRVVDPSSETKRPSAENAVVAASPIAPQPTTPPSKQAVTRSKLPNSLDEILLAQLSKLPDLIESNSGQAGPPPRRIGDRSKNSIVKRDGQPPSSESGNGPVVHVAATQTVSGSRKDDSSPTPMIKRVSESTSNQSKPEVIPASHSSAGGRSNDEQVKLAETEQKRTQQHLTMPATTASRQQQELTEDELFSQLLQKVGQPRADETPLERERRMIVSRHLMVLAGDPNAATDQMKGLNETEQKYLRNHLLGLWTMIDPNGHPSSGRRITEALPKFQAATRYMAAATDSLTLRNLEFCTEIEAYGQVKPFDENRFVAGQQVILYCEVENFAADRNGELFRTKLQGSYDVYDRSGTKVLSQLLPVDEQQSRNQLRDYFVAYQMNLPKQLALGSYRLQLTIEDAVGNKYGQANLSFEIKP